MRRGAAPSRDLPGTISVCMDPPRRSISRHQAYDASLCCWRGRVYTIYTLMMNLLCPEIPYNAFASCQHTGPMQRQKCPFHRLRGSDDHQRHAHEGPIASQTSLLAFSMPITHFICLVTVSISWLSFRLRSFSSVATLSSPAFQASVAFRYFS